MNFVILAELEAQPGREEDFAALMTDHAAASLTEPGCQTFDVCRDEDDEKVFVLYEVYDDEAAYRAHRESAHYARFLEAAPDMLVKWGDQLFVSRRVLLRE